MTPTPSPLAPTTLASCPFCGGLDFLKVDDYQFPPDAEGPAWKWGYHVVCSAAGFDNQQRGCGCSSAWGETPDEAIEAWNRRAPPAPASVDAAAIALLNRLRFFSDAPSDDMSDQRWHFDVLPAMRELTAAIGAGGQAVEAPAVKTWGEWEREQQEAGK